MSNSVYNEHGVFLGARVDRLTQLDGDEESLLQYPPFGLLKEIGGDSYTPYYAQRTVYCEGGCRSNSVRQALINFLGSPSWINIEFNDVNAKY